MARTASTGKASITGAVLSASASPLRAPAEAKTRNVVSAETRRAFSAPKRSISGIFRASSRHPMHRATKRIRRGSALKKADGMESWEAVISYFVRTYQEGQTPNPCVVCNRRIKFGAMWDTARAMGADCLATGHYAKIGRDRATGRYVLRRGADRAKDQSYFLCRLTQEQLSRTLFPLGTLTKPEVRRLAEAHGLVSAHKRDSQDICFIPDGDYAGFIDRCVGEASPTGPFLDEAGRVLGQHKGFVRYTKGQHKGLGLAIEPPLYVTKKDSATHAIYVGPSGALFTTELTAGEWNGIALAELTAPVTVSVKTRYSQREAEATAEPLLGGRFRLRFREPQRAVTPGQFAVLYDGEDVVGSGVILE